MFYACARLPSDSQSKKPEKWFSVFGSEKLHPPLADS